MWGKPTTLVWFISFCVSMRSYMLDVVAISAALGPGDPAGELGA